MENSNETSEIVSLTDELAIQVYGGVLYTNNACSNPSCSAGSNGTCTNTGCTTGTSNSTCINKP